MDCFSVKVPEHIAGSATRIDRSLAGMGDGDQVPSIGLDTDAANAGTPLLRRRHRVEGAKLYGPRAPVVCLFAQACSTPTACGVLMLKRSASCGDAVVALLVLVLVLVLVVLLVVGDDDEGVVVDFKDDARDRDRLRGNHTHATNAYGERSPDRTGNWSELNNARSSVGELEECSRCRAISV